MTPRAPRLAVALAALIAAAAPRPAAARPDPAVPGGVLRVCADPNDLPFSDARGRGFENRVAAVLARALGARLELVPWPQRRGWVRNTLTARRCDVVMASPAGLERVLTTRPWYRSSYVFVAREDRGLRLSSIDDPRLHFLRIGVQLVGDEGASSPPVLALGARGMVDNLVGFPVYGDVSEPVPGGRVVDAVRRGEVDVAVVWGPRAGWLAARPPRLVLAPVSPPSDGGLRFAFSICAAVRKGDRALRDALDRALAARAREIERILDDYGVPRVPDAPVAAAREAR